MSWLSALVASALGGGLRWAVAAQVAGLAAVVALLSLGAVARHVADTTAGVAGLLALSTVTTAVTGSTTVAGILVTTSSSLWAVAGDVADLGALVALLGRSTVAASTSGTLGGWVGTVTADVSGLAAYSMLDEVVVCRQNHLHL